ncbi:GGDEF domain-containing protein [Thalassotalea fusca]
MKTIFNSLERRTTTAVIVICLLVVLFIVAVAISLNSIDIVEPLFILPIVIVSWYGGRTAGFSLVALIVTLSLFVKHSILEISFLYPGAIFHLIFHVISYLLIAILVINFRDSHNEESLLASTDGLTGLLNTRSFSIELANEILRSIRYEHIFSLAYIDIDNFKHINDSIGHQEGDKLLTVVSRCLSSSLRKTDIVARLGGDEFAVIFPETGQQEVKSAFANASNALKRKMKNNKWSVSFSVGIVTFEKLPTDIKEAIKISDELMYTVKKNKKNDVAFQVWQGKA